MSSVAAKLSRVKVKNQQGSAVKENPKRVAKITIEISEFENVKYLADGDSKLGVSIAYRGRRIDGPEDFDPSGVDILLTYELQIDVNDKSEVFDLLTNPLQGEIETCRLNNLIELIFAVTLLKFPVEEEDAITLGYANIDLHPLKSSSTWHHAIKFERDNCSSRKIPIHRKVSCTVKTFRLESILDEPLENCLYVTIDSVYNVDVTSEPSRFAIGYMASLESQVCRFFYKKKS